MSVRTISWEALTVRAVKGARPRRAGSHPRWVAIEETFALGSTYSRELCRIAGVDPDELMSRKGVCKRQGPPRMKLPQPSEPHHEGTEPK